MKMTPATQKDAGYQSSSTLAKQISSDRLKATELPVKDNGFGLI